MKVRAGFVSNSSSTSFLIITKGDLSRSGFLSLMGVSPDSPIADLFEQLYDDVCANAKVADYAKAPQQVPAESWFDDHNGLSERMIEKLRDAKARGLTAYYGSLDSETNNIQSFFCTDSFELENEKIYFNALECVW